MSQQIIEGQKLCSHCMELLPLDAFAPNPRLSTGWDSWCRECHLAAARASRAKHRERYNAERREPVQTKACDWCEEPFETSRAVQRFCSSQCRRADENERRKLTAKEAV